MCATPAVAARLAEAAGARGGDPAAPPARRRRRAPDAARARGASTSSTARTAAPGCGRACCRPRARRASTPCTACPSRTCRRRPGRARPGLRARARLPRRRRAAGAAGRRGDHGVARGRARARDAARLAGRADHGDPQRRRAGRRRWRRGGELVGTLASFAPGQGARRASSTRRRAALAGRGALRAVRRRATRAALQAARAGARPRRARCRSPGTCRRARRSRGWRVLRPLVLHGERAARAARGDGGRRAGGRDAGRRRAGARARRARRCWSQPGDPAALAAAIGRLLDDPALARAPGGRRPGGTPRRRGGAAAMVDRTLALYEGLAGAVRVLLATPGTDVGGAERVVITLARELPQRGHEVVLWGPAGALEPELAGAPIERRRRARTAGARRPAWSRASRGLADAIRRTRPAVVHAHNPRVSGLAVARCPARPRAAAPAGAGDVPRRAPRRVPRGGACCCAAPTP